MCTVTYLPLSNGQFVLTSNRDENPNRRTIKPQSYFEQDSVLTYPKDEVAGGTWIGVSDKKRLICLLNGGFENHFKAASYKISRGVVVKRLLTVTNFISEIEMFDFYGVEPFTMVLVDWCKKVQLFEFVWTGSQKSFKKLKNEPKIWSSSTLYTAQQKALREMWFLNWLKESGGGEFKNILDFHQNTSLNTDRGVTLMMKRENVQTISTTVVKKKADEEVSMEYTDYLTNTVSNVVLV